MPPSSFKNRRISHLRSPGKNGGARAKQDKWDVWLPRLSHFSQFGLFVITLGTLYFTVLPLYQKAVLEEAIAKKEIELKGMSLEVERLYTRFRTDITKRAVLYADLKCSGVSDPLPELSANAKDLLLDLKQHKERVLNPKLVPCLRDRFEESTAFKELRPKDLKVFMRAVQEVTAKVGPIESEFIREYRYIPTKAEKSPDSLAAPDAFMAKTLDLWTKQSYFSPAEIRKRRADASISAEENRLRRAYRQKVTELLSELEKIDWEAP